MRGALSITESQMKLTAREDIDAPQSEVYAALTDFAAFETAAQRRGAEVARNDSGTTPRWEVAFAFRHRLRRMTITLVRQDMPNTLEFDLGSPNMSGTMTVDLVVLGPRRTRMNATLEVRPKTLAARLVVQSLKLAKARVLRKYRARIAQFASLLEHRLKPGQQG